MGSTSTTSASAHFRAGVAQENAAQDGDLQRETLEGGSGNLDQGGADANRGLAELVDAPTLGLAVLAVFTILTGLILVPPRAGNSRA